MRKFILFLSPLLMISLQCIAEGQGFYGFYTNISAEGEPSGMEMLFLNDGRGGRCDTSVLFQVMEGWPQYPELLDCCACSAKKIEFDSKKWGKFVGKMGDGKLTGEFVEAKYKVTLPKGQSYWQKH